MPTDRDHLNTIFQICGTPDAVMMSKIESEDVSAFFSLLTAKSVSQLSFLGQDLPEQFTKV